MQYIDALKKISIFLLVLAISACSTLGKKEKETEEMPEVVSEIEGEDAPFVLMPDPYTPGNVPGSAQQEFANIKALVSAKKWGQAKSNLDVMIQTYPKLSGPYINLGIVHFKLKEYEDAEKAFQFAIETNPQNLDAYTALGLLYRGQGRFAEAEDIYLKALQVWPHHLASNINLGILYDLYMGRFEDALKHYELSQLISGGEDRQLKGWIADTKRRINEK